MNISASSVWDKCLAFIKDNIQPQAYKTWFLPIKPVRLNDNVLSIEVPSKFFYEWLEEHYIKLLKTALQKAQIGVVMEGVRQSASKAQKMVKIASTGKVKLEQLVAPKVDKNDAKKKSRKLKMRAEAEMSRMLRESQSAGEMYSHLPSFEEHKFREASAMYVSPYELPYNIGMDNSMEAALIEARKEMERKELQQGASL